MIFLYSKIFSFILSNKLSLFFILSFNNLILFLSFSLKIILCELNFISFLGGCITLFKEFDFINLIFLLLSLGILRDNLGFTSEKLGL